jgi:hypothetical protein
MRVRTNLSSVVSATNKPTYTLLTKAKVGRVYGIITTENTPTKKQFEKQGGFSAIGTVFYLDYEQSVNVTGSNNDNFFDSCKTAKPVSQNIPYPLEGELIQIVDFPSSNTQISPTLSQKYYTGAISIWNNSQHNAQPSGKDYSFKTFLSNKNIRNLLRFEGDSIVQGRQGSALRFSSTTKLYNSLNEWSTIGSEDNPITILSNGFNYDPNKNFYVEQINKDLSSIYLTSAQLIPLQTDKTGVLNNLTNPIDVAKYINPQIIINSDRVVLNSKKDEIMLFAKTNIELNTKNIINLNADERIHLNSKAVFLGPYDATHIPQPLLLGNNTVTLLSNVISSLYDLGCSLSSVVGSPEGSPALDINAAGDNLMNSLERIIGDLNNILSKQNFTV